MPLNYPKWGLVLSILGIGIAGAATVASITIPEIRCFLRLECQDYFRLLVVTEESKPLEGVEAFFLPSGSAPVVKRTNSDGYVQIKLPNKGDIEITLRKDGYETLTHIINLYTEPDLTRTFRLRKKSTGEVLPKTSPNGDTSTTPTTTPMEKECERTRGYIAEDYYGEILVNRTFKKSDKRIELSTTNPYSVVCKIINNKSSLSLIYAIPDDSKLKKVNISLYLDGKLSKSVDVNRGSLLSLTADTKNISNYSIEYTVEDAETRSSDYLYIVPTSN